MINNLQHGKAYEVNIAESRSTGIVLLTDSSGLASRGTLSDFDKITVRERTLEGFLGT